jgi:DUF4097 and DUF4098 domain-containing protein YvlB
MPPGGIPPYDPKTQWRVYREQQKAAWRAQRDAWKAQRYAWKAGYVGTYGPRVPSVVGPIILVAVGIIALFIATGHIAATDFWTWYAHWWPVLLIIAGLALLGEWALDLRRDTPVRRGGSFIGILILVAIIGLGASGWSNWWGPFRAQIGDNGDDFFNAFGQPQHDNDAQVLNTQIPANAAIEIQDPRGDISIASADTTSIQVEAHEVAFTNSDSEAKKIFAAEAPHVTVTGNAVLVKSDSNSSGRLNLTITVPHSAHVTVNSGRGDVTVAGLGAGVNVTSPHGDVHLSSITGSVQVHLANDKHDFSAHQVTGDITADGNCNDLTLSDTKGRVTINGEIFGEVHLESISGPVDIHTSVTDLQLAELTGDLTLNSDDLRVTEAKGPVHVVTHAKDVDLSQIYGDTHVENRDGRISVEPAGNYAVEAKNSKGDVELTLPPNASASIDGHTHNGDIVSDYELTISGDENKTVTGRVGGGGSKMVLTAENGDLRIKKGSGFSTTTSTGSSEDVPKPLKAPTAPNAPHLKAQKALPAQPVKQ